MAKDKGDGKLESKHTELVGRVDSKHAEISGKIDGDRNANKIQFDAVRASVQANSESLKLLNDKCDKQSDAIGEIKAAVEGINGITTTVRNWGISLIVLAILGIIGGYVNSWSKYNEINSQLTAQAGIIGGLVKSAENNTQLISNLSAATDGSLDKFQEQIDLRIKERVEEYKTLESELKATTDSLANAALEHDQFRKETIEDLRDLKDKIANQLGPRQLRKMDIVLAQKNFKGSDSERRSLEFLVPLADAVSLTSASGIRVIDAQVVPNELQQLGDHSLDIRPSGTEHLQIILSGLDEADYESMNALVRDEQLSIRVQIRLSLAAQ